jgi:hypothetical protein
MSDFFAFSFLRKLKMDKLGANKQKEKEKEARK